jgi:hypothetical protein
MCAAAEMPRQARMLAPAQAGKLEMVGNDGRSARDLADRRLRALWGLRVTWIPGVLGGFRLLSIRRGPWEGHLFHTAWFCWR